MQTTDNVHGSRRRKLATKNVHYTRTLTNYLNMYNPSSGFNWKLFKARTMQYLKKKDRANASWYFFTKKNKAMFLGCSNSSRDLTTFAFTNTQKNPFVRNHVSTPADRYIQPAHFAHFNFGLFDTPLFVFNSPCTVFTEQWPNWMNGFFWQSKLFYDTVC